MRLTIPIRCAVGSTVLAALPLAAQDLTIVSAVTTAKGTSQATSYMTSERYRNSDADTDSIIEFTTGRMTNIDHKKKEYWETTLQEMEAAFRQMEAQMAQMSEQMQQMPAFLRDKMGGPAGPITVQKGTATRKIAGYDCDQYTISMGEAMRVEMWTTPHLQVPTPYYDARKAFFASNPMTQKFGKLFDEMRKIKGYPLAETTTMKLMGTQQMTREATEVRKGPIPASAFALPAGYKKVESPFAKMMKK
jgi:hypothetical protein